MAVAYKSAGALVTAETSGAALSPLCPATVDANDILIAHAWYEGTSTAPSTPSGWELLAGPYTVESAYRHWVFGKIAAGTEDGSAVAFGTPAVTTMRAARVYSFSGYVAGTILQLVRNFAHLSHATDPQMPTVVTTVAASLAVGLVGQADDNAQASATGESGGDWTLAVEGNSLATTPDVSLSVQTAAMANPGTISGGTVSTANDPCGVIGFELRPTNVLPGAAVVTPFTAGFVTNSKVVRPAAIVTPITVGFVTNGRILSRGLVSWAKLKIPKAAVVGEVVTPFTLGIVTSGHALVLGRIDAPTTFGSVVSGRIGSGARVDLPLTFGAVTNGIRTTRSAVDFPITVGTVTNGDIAATAQGIVSWAALQVPTAPILAQIDLPVTFTPVVSGIRTVYGAVSTPVTFGVVATASGGTSSAVTFTETFQVVTGQRVTVRAAVSMANTVTVVTNGVRTTHGAVVTPETFTVVTSQRVTARAAVVMPITVGIATTPGGAIAAQVSFPTTVGFVTNSRVIRYGAVAQTFTITVVTADRLKLSSSVITPFALTVTTGQRVTARSSIVTPITVNVFVRAQATYRSAVSTPITFSVTTNGATSANITGAVSFAITESTVTAGIANHKAAVSTPTTWGTVTASRMSMFSRVDSPFGFNVQASGFALRYATISFPITVGIETHGNLAGSATGRINHITTVNIVTTERLFALGHVDSPFAFTITTTPFQLGYGAVSLPLNFHFKSGNPIYRAPTIGIIANGYWGYDRAAPAPVIKKSKVRSLA
jgi:hypothetical protein